MADNIYGPVIPPHLLSRKHEEDFEEEISSKPKRVCTDNSDDKAKDNTKPQAPTTNSSSVYGPTLPKHLVDKDDSDDDDGGDSFGPKLPPDMINNSPPISPHLTDEEEDNEIIGPMLPPSDGTTSTDQFHQLSHEIDSRSREMRNKLTNQGSRVVKPSREEWMMELPPEIQVQSLGLGPRKFKTKYTEVGDRSVWTRMPGEPPPTDNDKKSSSESLQESVSNIRDQQLAKEVDEYNKSFRSESLMEMHKRKRAEKSQSQPNERRPFDRETDLAMPHKLITSSKRTSLIKDSQKSLDSKFARGKTSFL